MVYCFRNAVLCVLLLCSMEMVYVGGAHAYVDHPYGPFILRELKVGEKFYDLDNVSTPKITTQSFTDPEMAAVKGAMNYWQERILTNKAPGIIINLAFLEEKGKTAYNWAPENSKPDPSTYNYVVGGILDPIPTKYGYHTELVFNQSYNAHSTRLLMDDNSITSSITHEMMHALGMIGTLDTVGPSGAWKLISASDAWSLKLYDIYGTRAWISDNDSITVARVAGNSASPNIFYLPAEKQSGMGSATEWQFPTFRGDAVNELTGGRGMPVMAGAGIAAGLGNVYVIDGGNVLGHPALLGSIMSYSPLRNMLFTELELAVLKDMGYAIDLKKSFGKSYYPSNLGGKLTADAQLASAGRPGGYLYETPLTVTNTAGFDSNYSYGVGLHVYRDHLDVTQLADINASGYGAGGIRVDGVGNTVTLPADVTVAANGAYGTGVLVSYGKNNVLNIAGTVQATGDKGIGLHFGITGDPKRNMGNSYFHDDLTHYNETTKQKEPLVNSDDIYFLTKMNSDLNGPLASAVNISGSVAGSEAAIQVDRDAHVKEINILSTAKLFGNIYVKWDMQAFAPTDAQVKDYGTRLNFFGGANATLHYSGIIDGRVDTSKPALGNKENSSLVVNIKSGTVSLNKDVHAIAVLIDRDAVLKGNTKYDLFYEMGIFPGGRFEPGNSIGKVVINGDFRNQGTLRMEFDGQGGHDVLEVNGAFVNKPGARVGLAPAPGYFPSGNISLDPRKMFPATAVGDIPGFGRLLNNSPTVTFTSSSLSSPDLVTVQVNRAANAYSRFADTGNNAQVGDVLPGLAGVAQGDMQEMFTALDFSARDGSGIRAALPQLSAAPHAQAAQASAEANLHMGRMALTLLRTATDAHPSAADAGATTGLSGGDSASEWSAFVMPFGGAAQQQAYRGNAGYSSADVGLMGGVSRQTEQSATSVYSAFSRRQVDMWTTAGAQSRSSAVHVGAASLWREKMDQGWQVWGLAQLGVENTDMRRSIAIGDYARENTSSWTSLNGMASVGGAYLWRAGAVSLGPQVGVEYAFNALPAVEEGQGGGTRLATEAYTRHDLRGTAGLMASWRKDLGEDRSVRASVEAVWRQDLLPAQRNVSTHFVGYSEFPFDSRVARDGQGSLGLVGGIQVNLRQDVTLGAQLEADVLRPGYSSVGGGLTLRWTF